MDKRIWIGLSIALVLVLGGLFASANLETEVIESGEEKESSVCGAPEPSCGADTCNFDCGGNCGISSCGCGR
ncbi:hypothetical protein GF323_05490 [Candidatus Woesearchaeota archaeon]|nr:hypothetical protein [Candidatus Woesearchaeota archaeon]